MRTLILNEEKLVEACIRGDRKAQEALYQKFYEEMYLIAMRYLSDHDDTEDAIIQAFTKTFKNLNSFQYQGQGSLGKWVRTILIHEAIKLLKKRNRMQFEAESELIQVESETVNGIEQMQASDIIRMIERLPAGYRTIFNLYVIEGYTHREIAQMMEISENTSKTQLMKARKVLMKQLKEEKYYGTA